MYTKKREDSATPLFNEAHTGHADVCTVLLEHKEKWLRDDTSLLKAAQKFLIDICSV